MDSFSTTALRKMHERANDFSKKVGRVLYESNPAKYKDYTWTDCSTYSTNVLSDAYIELGQPTIAKKVRALATNGNDLAHYLVTEQSWTAIFVSSDVYHPHDGIHGHGLRYFRADKKCLYGKVPISYFAINFRPTPSPRRLGPLPKNFLRKSAFGKSTAWPLRSHKLIETKQILMS